jgi:thioredoxin-related protein
VKSIVLYVPIVVKKKSTMKKTSLIVVIFLITASYLFAQTEGVHIYNPDANAKEDIAKAVRQAKAENKQVLLQIGGNWCPWCVRLHEMETTDNQIDSLLKADYVLVLVNVPKEKEKRNPELMASLGNPQRFGFPVLVILDQEGVRLHTQDSWYLEKDKYYDKEKVVHFLEMWNVAAVKQ